MLKGGCGFHGRRGWIGGERILKRVWKVKKGPSSSQNVLWRCFKRGKRVGLSNTMGGTYKDRNPSMHQLSGGPRSNAPKRSITVDSCDLDSFALGDGTPFPRCSTATKLL